MDDADARLDVPGRVTGERSPSRAHQSVSDPRPAVDCDAAVPQLCDCAIELRRVLLRCRRVDEDDARESPPARVVGKCDRSLEELCRRRRVQRDLGEDAAERLVRQRVLAPHWRDVGDDGPRHDPLRLRAEHLRVRVGAEEPLVPLLGPRVVGLAWRRPREFLVDELQKPLLLRPAPGHDEHLRRVAVEAGVLRDHAGDLPRLEPEVRRGP